MDIQKPGESAPDSSSRPIIVTNRPILQDPMMKDVTETTDAEAPKAAENVTTSGEKTISPPVEAKQEEAKIVEDTATDTAEEHKDEPPVAAATDSIDPESSTTSADAAVVDAVVNADRGNQVSDEQKAKDADEKRKQAVQALIDTKKYIVPVGQVTRARHNRNTLWLFILIALIVAAYVVADSGLVNLPFELPVDLIGLSHFSTLPRLT